MFWLVSISMWSMWSPSVIKSLQWTENIFSDWQRVTNNPFQVRTISFKSDCWSKPLCTTNSKALAFGMPQLIHRPEQYTVSSCVLVWALWSSPWESCPSFLGELPPQQTGIQRKWLHNWRDSINLVSHWERLTEGPLTSERPFFLSQPPLKYLSPQLIAHWSIIHLPRACDKLLTCSWWVSHPLIFVTPLRWIYWMGFSLAFSWHLSNHRGEQTWADISLT